VLVGLASAMRATPVVQPEIAQWRESAKGRRAAAVAGGHRRLLRLGSR
jgi:hypothetical protein